MPDGMASGKFHGAMTTPTPARLVACTRCVSPGGSSTARAVAEPQRLAAVVLAEVDRLADVGVGLGAAACRPRTPPGRRARRAGARMRSAARNSTAARVGATASRASRTAPRRAVGDRAAPRRSTVADAAPADDRRACRPDRPRAIVVAGAIALAVDRAAGTAEAELAARPARSRATSARATSAGAARRAARCTKRPGVVGVGRRRPAARRCGRTSAPSCGGAMSVVERPALREAVPHERLVRRVLQQTAHEVGHARHQVADRHVDPHAQAELARRRRAAARPCRTAPGTRPHRRRAPSRSSDAIA